MVRLREGLRSLFGGNSSINTVPALDGAFTPNSGLDGLRTLQPAWGSAAPDDIGIDGNGDLLVAADRMLCRCRSPDFAVCEPVASFEQPISAMCVSGHDIYCGMSGGGLVCLGPDGQRSGVDSLDGSSLNCITALSVGSNGRVYGCEGSSQVRPEQWHLDLMSKGASGRTFSFARDLNDGQVIDRNLRWPAGILAGGERIVWTESWPARVCARSSDAQGPADIVIPNLPGYPGRLALAVGDGYWLSIFAPRTLLIDFILKEDEYRIEMMRRIPSDLWIRPALRADISPLEPLQGGGIRKLGQQNPWAPPRAYGLVARLDETGEPLMSLHSRVGGTCHGVTAVCETADRLFICSKGHGQVFWKCPED